MNKDEFDYRKEDILKSMANRHALRYYAITSNVMALIGKKYAIMFFVHLGQVDVFYWKEENDSIIEYPFDNFIASSVTNAEREGVHWGEGHYNRVLAELQVFTNTLENHWGDILDGGLGWLKQYNRSKYGYTPRITKRPEVKEIKQLMQEEYID